VGIHNILIVERVRQEERHLKNNKGRV
jgi:hypothetical protein